MLGRESKLKFLIFEDIYSVEKSNVDIWKGEADIKILQAKQKLILHTKDKVFEFFAESEKEREVWVEYFCRVLDHNEGLVVDLNVPSKNYMKIARDGARSVTKYTSGNQPTLQNVRGFQEYRSQTLTIKKDSMQGVLIKKIEVRKLYHMSNYHKRHFIFDW